MAANSLIYPCGNSTLHAVLADLLCWQRVDRINVSVTIGGGGPTVLRASMQSVGDLLHLHGN